MSSYIAIMCSSGLITLGKIFVQSRSPDFINDRFFPEYASCFALSFFSFRENVNRKECVIVERLSA